MVLPKAIEKFRFHCVYEKNLSLKTMHAYDADLNQFLEKFKNYKINEISKFDLKDYVESLFNHPYKIKTIKRKIAVLKTFFNYLEFDEILEININNILEYITLENGDLLRGYNRKAEEQNGILNYFVSYNLFVNKVREKEASMETLSTDTKIKETEE